MTLPLFEIGGNQSDQFVYASPGLATGRPAETLWVYYGGAWFNTTENYPKNNYPPGPMQDNYSGYHIDVLADGGDAETGVGIPSGSLTAQLIAPDYRWTDGWQLGAGVIEGPLVRYFDADDLINGLSGRDQIFSGPGDDTLYLNSGTDWGIGGDGDDVIHGGGGTDLIYGDWSNVPVYNTPQNAGTARVAVSTTAENYPIFYDFAIPDESSPARSKHFDETGTLVDGEPAGNDQLFGDGGSDTLWGGPGNDQLDGGPRGDGWTDLLYGGPGADMFYLSYETAQSSPEAQESWWASWGEDVAGETGADVTTKVIEKLAEKTAEKFFGEIAGGALLGGVTGAAYATITDLIGDLFKHSAPQPPPVTTEDVMVVADFDPREDVLFLPMENNKTLTAQPAYFASAAVDNLQGWGATFSTIDGVYAEVFLDDDFLNEFGVSSGSQGVEPFIKNLFNTGLKVGDTSLASATGGIVNPDSVYPFQDYTASDYTDGVIPQYANSTPLNLTAPSGSQSTMFGAFAPQVVYGPAIGAGLARVAGTNMADVLSVNATGFAPWNYLDPANLLYEDASLIKGFGGNDIIFGGAGQDALYGGDGDDRLYSFATGLTTSGPLRESLYGEDGDDILYTGGSAANLDGGDGTDTASFAVSPYAVWAILATGSGYDIGQSENTYLFADIENLEGSAYGDRLNGDDGDNVISGLGGNDALTGRGGNDTLIGGDGYDSVQFYGGGPGTGATVDLARNFGDGRGPVGLWRDAYGGSDTVDRASVEAYVGTAGDDQFKGNGGNGTNPLYSADFYGLGGDDTLVGSGLAESLDGGDGIDNLQGLGGADTLTGGAGNDTFKDDAANWSGDIVTDFETGDTVVVLGFSASEVTFDTPGAIGATVKLDGAAAIQLQGPEFDNKNLVATQSGNDTYIFAPASVSATPITDGGNATGRGDIIDGSNEADLLIGRGGNDRLNGNGGDDTVIGGAGKDTLRGEDGDDTLRGGAGDDIITGNDGNDTLTGGSGRDSLYAGRGADRLDGGSGADELDGGEGNDVLRGGNGHDTIEGGDGDDTVSGGRGNDTVNGGDGDDILRGGTGRDTLEGGDGDDIVHGGRGGDIVYGGDGDDTVSGGRGNDTVFGGDGDDILRGGGGRDTVEGGDGDDIVNGGLGNDTVSGGDGNDTVNGGRGNDVLAGGPGSDFLIGGFGIDTFVFEPGGGTDTANDFELGVDLIALANDLSFGDLSFDGSEIWLGGELLAILDGVDAGTLGASDFLMV